MKISRTLQSPESKSQISFAMMWGFSNCELKVQEFLVCLLIEGLKLSTFGRTEEGNQSITFCHSTGT